MKFEQIENELSYMLNPKKAKRKSHKKDKQLRNRTLRRKSKQNPIEPPNHKEFKGWEW